MKRISKPTGISVLLALAAAFLLWTGLLGAGPEGPPPSAPAAGEPGALQTSEPSTTPLPNFRPSEELPADAAVAFPTDI